MAEGAFSQLVSRTGGAMAAHLRSVARGEESPRFLPRGTNEE